MRRVLPALCLLVFVAAATVTAAEAEWPMFRGADRSGISKETGLLKSWPDKGPPLAWKTEGIGIGFSSVSVKGDRVFTMGDVGKECFLFGIDRKTGNKVWDLKIGKNGGNYEGPRCTPATDGEHVYALGQFGDLVCAATKDGKEVWRKNLPKDFGGRSGGWNYTESPLIDGDHLIVTPGGDKATMVALDKKSGQPVWSGVVPKGDTAGYASIVIANFGGVKQYVTLMANGLVSFDAKSGQMLWRYGTTRERFGGNTANIPTPIIYGEYVFAAAGYGRGAALLKITKDSNEFMVEEIYWKKELNNKHGGVIQVGDKLYGDKDSDGNLWCADFKTGKVLWTRKGVGEGRGSASLTYADGKLYVRYSDGAVVLVDADADKYVEISAFKVANKGNTWAHPVVVDGKFYVREREILYCYDVKAR